MILKNRATLAALALLAASAMVAGCIRDAQWLDPDDGKSEGDLVLVLNMPGGFRPPGQSRAPISSGDEEKIDDLWVLMFDNSPNKLLIDIARASQTSDTPITFSVPLPSTLTVGSQVNLVLLANSEDILNAPGGIGTTLNNIPSVNRYYNNLMPLITAGVDGKLVTGAGASLRIPMWGESTTVTIQAEGNVVPQTISMLRALARVDVGVGQLSGNEGNFTWDGLDGAGRSIPFDITSVYVVRPNNFYRLVPDAAKTQSGLPSVPTVATPLEVSDAASFCYTVTGGGITREIYIPEADIKSGGIDRHRDRMALVVGGIFDNSGIETFYRVDFGDGEDLDDVLRNHIYTFSIHGVLVAGEPTVEAAYGSQSINMQVDIHDWDEGFNWNIWFENSKYIAMNRQQLTFSPLPGETVDVRVLTNIVDGDSPDEGIFSFSLFDDPNETIVLSTARPGPYTGPAGYIYTIIPVAVGEYTLRVQNPIANIGDSDASRVENWVIHSLGLAINFHVGQSYSRGGVFRVNGADLTTGQGAFLTPEGNTGNPIHFEIITMEAGTIEVYNADGSPATWIDLGNTGALQTPTNGYYHYTNDLVVAPYRYNNGSTVDRTAIITITSGARTIHYNVSQQAPYIRTERKTVAVNNPNMTTSTIVPVYITTNIDPANLLVSQTGGLGSPISLSSGSSLVSYDPRNPANQRFDVRVQFQAGDDNTYRATFNVADTSGMYGSLPAVSIDVVVPPATWTFGAFWQEGTFAGDPNAPAWAPSTQEWSHGAPTYIFPWNTTEVSFELDSNVGVEFDAATMTSDDMSHLTPAPGVGGVYTFDTRKNSYNTISRHHLAFTSDPEITTDDPLLLQRTAVDFSLGIQIFQVSNNAYTGNNIDWQGVDAADQAEFKLVSNVLWQADVTDGGDWLQLQAVPDGAAPDPADFKGVRIVVDDQQYAPIVADPALPYEHNTRTQLVNNTDLQYTVEPLDFYEPFNAAQPESRSATITLSNRSYDASIPGPVTPAPITITQWNRVLRNEALTPDEGGMPTHTILQPDDMEKSYTFAARTNLDEWRVDIWQVEEDGETKVVTTPYPLVSKAYEDSSFYSELSASSAPVVVKIDDLELPEAEVFSRNLLITLSANGLTQGQEQRVGMWTQPSSNPHPGLAFDDSPGLPAPPGVLGVGVQTGRLTLRGSKEYANVAGFVYPPDLAAAGMTYATETVYAVLFKRGSLVGLSTNRGANAYGTGEIIWAPAGYDVESFIAGNATWLNIPSVGGAVYPTTNSPANITAGTGDPCGFIDGNDAGGASWKTPTGSYDPYPGYWDGPNGRLSAGANWNPATTLSPRSWSIAGITDTPITVNGWSFLNDTSTVLPATGYRDATGSYNGAASGNYLFWINIAGATYGSMYINGTASTQFSVSAENRADSALPIRCVPR